MYKGYSILVSTAAIIVASATSVSAQTAQLVGVVLDTQERAIPGVEISIIDKRTSAVRIATSDKDGYYAATALQPGVYRITASKTGFRTATVDELVLETAQKGTLNVTLLVGTVAEAVTVTEQAPLINREDASVETTIDSQFLDSAPLNGRTLQSLFDLIPGMVVVPSTSFYSPGQFSVNGQRTSSNYLLVDGVGANVSTDFGTSVGQRSAGALPALSQFGGTNTLVSVDALEEFKVQTSSFAPEFGRTPGGEISLTTRSGGNAFHGGIFEYFRNTVLNATDWFADSTATPKAALRQNQYGGTFSGPIRRNTLFFFASYEGLRLLQPTYTLFNVPSMSLRESAPAALQPYLNGFALPNGHDLGNGLAVYNSAYDQLNSMNAGSMRLDWLATQHLTTFFRYNEAPSSYHFLASSNSETSQDSRLRTVTAGTVITISPWIVTEARVNYTSNRTHELEYPTNIGGAITLNTSLLTPGVGVGYAGGINLEFVGYTSAALPSIYYLNALGSNKQWNFLNDWNITLGRHQIKGGIDYRHLAPRSDSDTHYLNFYFTSEAQVLAGVASQGYLYNEGGNLGQEYVNVSTYLQDEWRLKPNLTLTYGARWELDPAPSSANGLHPYAVIGYDNLSTMTLASGTAALWRTRWDDIAPRLGIAWSPSILSKLSAVMRGGIGVFYDTAQSLGALGFDGPPFSQYQALANVPFPLQFSLYPPPSLTLTIPYQYARVFDPELRTPYTTQWNVSSEGRIGASDIVSVTYVGASGHSLINGRTVNLSKINPLFGTTYLYDNSGFSSYNALQLKWVRRLAKHLDGQAQYTWSHCIDNASSDLGDLNLTKGNCDFDVRQAFGALLTATSPFHAQSSWEGRVIKDWILDTTFTARSGLPLNINTGTLLAPDGTEYYIRPNVVADQPLWIYNANAPGHRELNSAAFSRPSGLTPSGAYASGTLGRNVITGFPIWQLDAAIRRTVPVGERLSMEIRLEAFNVLNHPNFGAVQTSLTASNFGVATSMLATQVGGSQGGLATPFQTGGPRSLQLALRLRF